MYNFSKLYIIFNGDYMKLFKNIIIPIIFGAIVGLISGMNNNYNNYIKPDITPPNIVFPIVWTILYALMGISNYLVLKENYRSKLYIIQLVLNLLWSIIFFNLKLYLLAFIWVIVLTGIVILMIIEFFKVNKLAAYLQIPYVIWLIFASFLTYQVYLLN